MKKVGFIGWRGMVGSVLMERMKEENDFGLIKSYFFSTTQQGQIAPAYVSGATHVLDAHNLQELREMDIILTCQGGDYTSAIHPQLRTSGWQGFWIDAASTLRLNEDSVIVLEPVNRDKISAAMDKGVKDFVGGNCTVSLLLIALHGLFQEELIEWVSSMTYQAASGAGAKHMLELMEQMGSVGNLYRENLSLSSLEMEKKAQMLMGSPSFPLENFTHPLALNILPWIDSEMPSGQSKEEWKAQVEANKILETKNLIPIDGTCVRTGSLRCHAQALTIKLKKSVDISTVQNIISQANPWVKLVPNTKTDTLNQLTPISVSGSMNVPIGRLRKMNLGDLYLNAFTCGDQLLWGAAEPLRCVLRQIIAY
jgi:aspartate-semialdehyde dehydrogenase